ncbi:hypothetical protein Hanom_Chr13g01229751 [Helianthus anomalus]
MSFARTYLSKRSFHSGKSSSFINKGGLSLLPTSALCLRFCTIAVRLLFAISENNSRFPSKNCVTEKIF